MEVGLQALQRFRSFLSEQTGLALDDDKDALLLQLIRERAQKLSLDADAYCSVVEQRPQQEVDAIADQLTVTETYFFRNAPHFEALARHVIPECVNQLSAHRRLRVLSAGCATGEEPYSLAMLLSQLHLDQRADVTGFDLNPASIEKARRGVYGTWALRETDATTRARWFVTDGRNHVLDNALRARVTLAQHSLMRNDLALLPPDHYDIILCRNVLMYFTPEMMRAAVARLSRALRPGGYLFLGHAETLRGVSNDFHLCHTHGTFYYQRKTSGERRQPTAPLHRQHDHAGDAQHLPSSTSLSPAALQDEMNGDWVNAIERASAKIAALVQVTESEQPVTPPSPAASNDQATILDLMRHEQSGRALDLLRRGHANTTRSADTRLLEAALLLQQDNTADAERECRGLLAIDELNAGAHYILALCEERHGHLEEAQRHDETAAYLDPTFAMPHVHLGLLLRRAGRASSAKQALARAHTLLETEDVARLILFGGGFDRDALKTLCRAELAAVEVIRE